jgi:hypothetical protein
MTEYVDVTKAGVTRKLQPQAVVLMDPATGNAVGGANAPMPVTGSAEVLYQTVNIANAASLSGVVDMGTARLARISLPAAWTAADLTLQSSTDGVTFKDLYDKDGIEYTIKAAASRAVLVPLGDMLSLRYLKIRSGTSATPVNQGASRDLIITLVP